MNIRLIIPHFLLFFEHLIHFTHIGPEYEYVKVQKIRELDKDTTYGLYQQKLNETQLDYLKIPPFIKKQISTFTTDSTFFKNNSSIQFKVQSNYYNIRGEISFTKKQFQEYDCAIGIYDMKFLFPNVIIPPFIKKSVQNQIYKQLIRDICYTNFHTKKKMDGINELKNSLFHSDTTCPEKPI